MHHRRIDTAGKFQSLVWDQQLLLVIRRSVGVHMLRYIGAAQSQSPLCMGGCGGQESSSVVLSRLLINQWFKDVANHNRI